ncbi:MAG TPA: hypothetical protein VN736_00950 [Candidatus Limnocylindrales bacterium]|nr:hypothetical protein [Candidatus Limnocylindrales bacterium]
MAVQIAMDALKTALRVLTAVRDKQPPDSGDLEALRAFAAAACVSSPEELACDVIQQALKRRAEVRSSWAGN